MPEDYVIATGTTSRVRDFVAKAFEYADIPNWEKYVEIAPSLFRPADVECLVGDATKAHHQLGWQPRVTFDHLVSMMVESDLQLVASKKEA